MTTHPYAAAQPTATGRVLWPLHVHDGQIYAGYGDYTANTGPCHIMSADPTTLAWTDHHLINTEAIYRYVTLSDGLYVPFTDPMVDPGVELYASNAGGAWSARNIAPMNHVFDMVERVPGELWAVGANSNYSVAWKRVNGVWYEALRIDPGPNSFDRFYFVGVIDESIYVERPRNPDTSRVWNGSAWSTGPDLLTTYGYYGLNPTPWGTGFLLHQIGHGYNGKLGYFNGTTMTWGDRVCTDYAVTENGIYALEPLLGIITHSYDFISWDTAAVAPSNAVGFAVIGMTGYLGLADSTIQTVSLVHSEPAQEPPEPPDPAVPGPPPPDPLSFTGRGRSRSRSGLQMLLGV